MNITKNYPLRRILWSVRENWVHYVTDGAYVGNGKLGCEMTITHDRDEVLNIQWINFKGYIVGIVAIPLQIIGDE